MWILALIAFLGSCAALVGVYVLSSRLVEHLETAARPAYDDRAILTALDAHEETLSAHAQALNDQRLAIAEGIEHVDRAERRVRATVARAKRRMEQAGFYDAGVEAEAEQLRHDDADPRGGEGVRAVPADVEGSQARDMSAFPGRW